MNLQDKKVIKLAACERCVAEPDLEMCGSFEDSERNFVDIMQCPFCKTVSVWH